MKNRIYIIMCIVPCILVSTKNFKCTSSSLTLFIRAYPELNPVLAATQSAKKFKKPEKIAQYIIPGTEYESVVAGIFAAYVGYLVASNYNGQITFPMNTISIDKPKAYILVTEQINPIMTFGMTVFRLEREPKIPAALYSIELKKDEDLNEHFWHVQSIPIPEDLKISNKTIIIFYNPKKIYIPEGITPARAVANILLPDIYIKKSTTKARDALYVLTIKHFFAPVPKEYQREPLKNIIQM